MQYSKNRELSAVSLFSGGGGLDLGIEAVGFTTLYAIDFDSPSCETLRTNQKTSSICQKPFLQKAQIVDNDIRELSSRDILSSINAEPDNIDLLIGGPPCQPFSISGQRKGSKDSRGNLIYDYIRLIGGIQPKAFIFENVKGLQTIENGRIYRDIVNRLQEPAPNIKYALSILCLNASDYGVPQNRERLFIIGSRYGYTIDDIPRLIDESDITSKRKRTVEDGLRSLPEAEADFPPNHHGRKHSERVSKRYASLRPGQRDPKTRINKLDLSKPSFTIVVGSNNGGGKGHIHPTEPREVTPRESARLQTFPDWWKFEGARVNDAIRQIGNAVPPLLGAIIANEIKYKMFKQPKVDFAEVVAILDQTHLQFNQ